MKDKDKIQVLKNCFQDVIWMAIRYAHGRNTYAPSTVRDAIDNFKKVFPEYELKHDRTIEAPDLEDMKGIVLESDYLHDLFKIRLNMIAHEKALELISEFRMILMEEDTECGNEILCTLIAKKCALLAVQKIIDSKPYGINDHIYYSTKSYWETVAKEIEEF